MFILETYGEYVREWWAEKVEVSRVDESKLTWGAMLSRWDAVETDFQALYNIDLAGETLLDRTWRWFRIRLVRLLAEDTQLARDLGLRDSRKT